MIIYFLLGLLVSIEVMGMHQKTLTTAPLSESSALDHFSKQATYENERNKKITHNQKQCMHDGLFLLNTFGCAPKNKKAFAHAYIQQTLIPALHTKTLHKVGQLIMNCGHHSEVVAEILNAEELSELSPYMGIAYLGDDIRTTLFAQEFFNGDKKAAHMLNGLPCVKAFQTVASYQQFARKPTMLLPSDILFFSPAQVNVCNHIEQQVHEQGQPALVPLSRKQEKVLKTLPDKILAKPCFSHL